MKNKQIYFRYWLHCVCEVHASVPLAILEKGLIVCMNAITQLMLKE